MNQLKIPTYTQNANSEMNYKSLSKKELRSWFKDLIEFKPEPFKHQYASVAFTLGENLRRIFLIHGIGTGKTLTSLFLTQAWLPQKTLIICPNSVIRTWEKELRTQSNFDFIALTGSKRQRIEKLALKRDFYILNYEGLKTLCSKPNEPRRKIKNIPDQDKINSLGFDCIIIDESHHLRNPESLQSKICEGITRRARYVIMMTGTPIGRNIEDLFSQMLVLDNGTTFGQSYSRFKNFYFYRKPFKYVYYEKRECGICGDLYINKYEHLKMHNMTFPEYFRKVGIDKTAKTVILDTVGRSSIRYSREECVDLPSITYEVREIESTPAQDKSTLEVIAGLDLEIIKSRLKYHLHKVIQITSGFIFDKGEVIHTFTPNPKLKELENLLEEIDEKFIIYHNYTYESILISKLLAKKNIHHAMLNGRIKNKDKELNAFTNDLKCKVLIAHPQTGGEGLDGLQKVSRIEVFFSNGFIGSILRNQAEGRIHRTGQNQACVIIDLVMKGTIDEVIYNSLKNQKAINNEILLYLQNTQKKS